MVVELQLASMAVQNSLAHFLHPTVCCCTYGDEYHHRSSEASAAATPARGSPLFGDMDSAHDPWWGESSSMASATPRRTRRKNTPTHLACHVCSDQAPNHVHYGGIACFSCRAFFRRSVPKHKSYSCSAERRCPITPITRKNCQYCRYQACLASGMKASWVLSEEEKEEREAKKNESKTKRTSTSCCSPRAPSPLPMPSAMPNRHVLSDPEQRQIEGWLQAFDDSKVHIAMPQHVLLEMQSLPYHNSPMSEPNIIEFFKVVYSRVMDFVGFIEDFRQLHNADKKSLLAKNMDILANIRLVTCFGPTRTGRDIAEQLERIFVEPWAKSKEHSEQYLEVMTRLSRLCCDKTTALLYQLTALFHQEEVSLEQPSVIESAQERMANLLQRHLVAISGHHEGNLLFANLIVMLHDLRKLADVLTG